MPSLRRHRPHAPSRPSALAGLLLAAALLAIPMGCGPKSEPQADAAPPAGCVLGEFDCQTGTECIDSGEVCDGTEDCSNGRDEADCGCGPGLYTCDDGQCIHAAFVCDHVVNCNDGSDERNCP